MSPELETISGTDLRNHHGWPEQNWHNNTDTVSIHRTQQTDIFSGCAHLPPSCHTFQKVWVCTACSYHASGSNVNADLANRTHKQTPKQSWSVWWRMEIYKCFLSTASSRVCICIFKEFSLNLFVKVMFLLVSLAVSCHCTGPTFFFPQRWWCRIFYEKISYYRSAFPSIPRPLFTNDSCPQWHFQQVLWDHV